MTILNALSKKSDYQLRILITEFRTIIFDEIILIYARDESLFDEAK